MADLTDEDFAFALSLQDELSTSSVHIQNATTSKSGRKRERSTSIVDECWETIDPTPDIWQMFLQFNQTYFEGKLAGCEVKWSPRMTLCAGVCCYEGRGGLCSIKLSLPLLKLRPRKDLVQTLLHEMIHALLFVTRNNKDHDAHGPEFHKHMYRINQQSGTNITVYHNFHDEVDLYRQHWWRCNGPCQKRPPYYGLVKRAMNRAPAERDPWWADHQQKCGGSYTKIKEPDDYGKKKRKIKDETSESIIGKSVPSGSGMVKISDMWKKESSSDSISTKDKENNMQKSNSGSASVITPFVGKGYALGTSKNGNSTETRSKLVTESLSRNKENSLFKSINRDASIDSKHGSSEKINGSREVNTLKTSTATEELQLKNELFKTPQQKSNGHRKLKRNDKLGSGSELTIIDAFKRVGKAEKVPIVVVNDSPAKPELSMVSCPICQTNVQKNLINSHLDNCLL